MLKLAIPSVLGLGLLVYLLKSYSKGDVSRREFLISLFISIVLILAPAEYVIVNLIAEAFGFYYTFVFTFFIATLFLLSIQIYVIRRINDVDKRTIRIVQEISLMRAELEERIRENDSPDDRS